jgi:hypothetical protein
MNIELQIKVTIIRRILNHMDRGYSTYYHALIASRILGCDVSETVINYVSRSTDEMIVNHISRGHIWAIELDNLKPNWR